MALNYLKLLKIFIIIIALITQALTLNAIDFEYYGSFGRAPSRDPGEFNYPSGVAVDSRTGDVYVMDCYFQRIQKFDFDGNYITQWISKGGLGISVDPNSGIVYVASPNYHKIRKYGSNGELLFEWGSYGDNNGQFKSPKDVSINPINGNVFVADSGNNRVQEFDSGGNFIRSWEGDFLNPYGISIDLSGQFVFVTSTSRLQYPKV